MSVLSCSFLISSPITRTLIHFKQHSYCCTDGKVKLLLLSLALTKHCLGSFLTHVFPVQKTGGKERLYLQLPSEWHVLPRYFNNIPAHTRHLCALKWLMENAWTALCVEWGKPASVPSQMSAGWWRSTSLSSIVCMHIILIFKTTTTKNLLGKKKKEGNIQNIPESIH